MDWRKIGYHLLYPHIAIILCLLPISVTFLVFSLIYLTPESILSIVSYLLAFYLLLVICFRVPSMITFFKSVKDNNKYIQTYLTDVHLRVNISLYGSFIFNVAFAIFQLVLGLYHQSFWFYSMCIYYIILAIMRFFLVDYTRKHSINENIRVEIKKSLLVAWLLLVMNLALALIVFFMVYWGRTFTHHMITTIALAAYTFFTFTFAIINIVKYRKYHSPVYSTVQTISLISASVSMLTLETTMLTTFASTESPLLRPILLTLTGIAVIGFAITMAIIMLVKGMRQLHALDIDTPVSTDTISVSDANTTNK